MFRNISRIMDFKTSFILLGAVLLFVLAPFYTQANIGGSGLALPYNTSIWTIASWIITAGVLLSVNAKHFTYPKLWLCLLIFPFIIIISSLMAEVTHPIAWLFRQLYILSGVLFLFALFQLRARQILLDNLLFVIVIATALHGGVGTIQIVAPEYLPSYFPPNSDLVPRGMFQQINVQASFLVTGLIVSLYLISRPTFRFVGLFVKVIIVIAFTLAMYVVIASGSRVGLLSLVLAIPLVIWSRFYQIRPHKNLLIVLLIASIGSFIAGQSGLDNTIDKTLQLTEKSYSISRIAMYTIGIELVSQEPIYGYGIGGFLGAWNIYASDFISRYPETSLPQYVTHPHNEILFWLIEAGLPAFLGIIVFAVGISIAIYRCGFQRGGAYAAMLLPISLHTQVELPFYISSLHWFLWLFLIFLVLRHSTKTVSLKPSLVMTKLVQLVAACFAVGVTFFMIHTARAQSDMYDFLYNQNVKPPYLQVALSNIYTKHYAEKIAMRSMLYASIENSDKSKVEAFESWAMAYVVSKPELKMYQDLISASIFLRPEEKGCDAINAGLAMYRQNKTLQNASEMCK